MSAALELDLRLPLRDFALEVKASSGARCLGIFGASGSGKTSLLEALAGWRREAAGRVRVGGRLLLDSAAGVDLPARRRGLAYVPQDGLLFPHRDVRGNVLAARPPAGDVERTLAALEITPLLDRPVATLSGGERQRVALARALCSRSEALLLDEPLASLDRPLRRRVLPWLLRARDLSPGPVLFVSHDPTEVQALCDEVLVLERGRVVAQGPPAAVLAERAPDADYENVLHGEMLAGSRLRLAGGEVVHVPETGLPPGARALVALRASDVLVATLPPQGLSARNVLRARLVDLAHRSGSVGLRVALGGTEIQVTLTQAAVDDLGLSPGREIHLVFKTSSCRILASS